MIYMSCISHGSRNGVAVEVEKDYPGAFYHCGLWYVWERDFKWTDEALREPILGS